VCSLGAAISGELAAGLLLIRLLRWSIGPCSLAGGLNAM
jgi:hypothetical protein